MQIALVRQRSRVGVEHVPMFENEQPWFALHMRPSTMDAFDGAVKWVLGQPFGQTCTPAAAMQIASGDETVGTHAVVPPQLPGATFGLQNRPESKVGGCTVFITLTAPHWPPDGLGALPLTLALSRLLAVAVQGPNGPAVHVELAVRFWVTVPQALFLSKLIVKLTLPVHAGAVIGLELQLHEHVAFAPMGLSMVFVAVSQFIGQAGRFLALSSTTLQLAGIAGVHVHAMPASVSPVPRSGVMMSIGASGSMKVSMPPPSVIITTSGIMPESGSAPMPPSTRPHAPTIAAPPNPPAIKASRTVPIPSSD